MTNSQMIAVSIMLTILVTLSILMAGMMVMNAPATGVLIMLGLHSGIIFSFMMISLKLLSDKMGLK